MEPNVFAYVILFCWPLLVLWLYRVWPTSQATIGAILGAQLILPVGAAVKIPMLPAIDRISVATVPAAIGCLIWATRSGARIRFGLVEILVGLFFVSPLITSLLNGDAVDVGASVLPGVGLYDGISAVLSQAIFFAPFLIARRFMAKGSDIELILRALAIAGLIYSILLLVEIRLSPQLHRWVYGYHPHSFEQHVREGGFRPMAFMGHGLLASFFLMTAVVAAAALWRAGRPIGRLPSGAVTGYLAAVLVLCKSLGALVYGVLLGALVRLTGPRLQAWSAMLLVGIALSYPVTRALDLFPTDTLVEAAASFSTERAQSLDFRFENEQLLLERGWKRFWFGWGRFGRNRVHDEQSGRDISVTDGRWIITFGTFGFVGFAAEFGLLALPVLSASRALRGPMDTREKIHVGALMLIVAVALVDQLPNASLSPWIWLLAGALLGRSEVLRREPAPLAIEVRPLLFQAPSTTKGL